jgi:hypothetical protein
MISLLNVKGATMSGWRIQVSYHKLAGITSLPLIILMGLSLLSGCTSVYFRHPQTGKIVKCGPYFGDPSSDHSASVLKRSCIEDAERQGYERVTE